MKTQYSLIPGILAVSLFLSLTACNGNKSKPSAGVVGSSDAASSPEAQKITPVPTEAPPSTDTMR